MAARISGRSGRSSRPKDASAFHAPDIGKRASASLRRHAHALVPVIPTTSTSSLRTCATSPRVLRVVLVSQPKANAAAAHADLWRTALSNTPGRQACGNQEGVVRLVGLLGAGSCARSFFTPSAQVDSKPTQRRVETPCRPSVDHSSSAACRHWWPSGARSQRAATLKPETALTS